MEILKASTEEILGIESDFLLKITVEFGSRLTGGKSISYNDLANALKAEGEKYHTSWLAQYLPHLAEHIIDSAKDSGGVHRISPSSRVMYYRGCGSCNPGGGNMGYVCDGFCELC